MTQRIHAVLFAGGLLLGAIAFFAPDVSHAAQERGSSIDLSAQQHQDVKEEKRRPPRRHIRPRRSARLRMWRLPIEPHRMSLRRKGKHRARSLGRKLRRTSSGVRQPRRDTLPLLRSNPHRQHPPPRGWSRHTAPALSPHRVCAARRRLAPAAPSFVDIIIQYGAAGIAFVTAIAGTHSWRSAPWARSSSARTNTIPTPTFPHPSLIAKG